MSILEQPVNITDYFVNNDDDELITFTFVKTSEEPDKEYDDAYAEVKKNKSGIIRVADANACLKYTEAELLEKINVFIFDKFDQENASFAHISNMKSIFILGPKCVLAAFKSNVEIPYGLKHVHNLSMKNMHICFASIADKQEKSRMAKRVGYMGALHRNPLTDKTTHLITEDLFSKKYRHAGSHNMKIMHPSWVNKLWKLNQSCGFNLKANDPKFNSLKLPVFHKLVITSTGLDIEERKTLTKLIETNGGNYSSTFKTSTIKILLMRLKDIDSAKHKASMKHNIQCVDPSWILKSIEAGYAMSTENFIVKKELVLKASTPTKNTSQVDKFNFDNTVISMIHDATTRSVTIDETIKSNSRTSVGPQRARRLDSVSHVSTSPPVKPAGKKEMTFKIPPLPVFENIDAIQPANYSGSVENQSDESFIQILVDKTICLYGYKTEIESMQVLRECEKLGATLVDSSYTKPIDYVITSFFIKNEKPKMNCRQMLSDVWIEDSVEAGHCIEPPKYFHTSIFRVEPEHQVLKNEIFSCSIYPLARERTFVRYVVEVLGGTCTEVLNKAEDAILICPVPEGKKFEGAKNWNRTVLTAEWLHACYVQKTRVDETNFLVGGTRPSVRNIKKGRDSIIPCSQDSPFEVDHFEHVFNKSGENACVVDSPKTPVSSSHAENEARVGNISLLVEDMPTPQRVVTKAVLLEQQKKSRISPRAQRLKDLMKTPNIAAAKKFEEYKTSPAPPTPLCMKAPLDGDYGLQPNSTPNSQWHYKRKIDALDERYVAQSESYRKAAREVSVTPPSRQLLDDFFKKRIVDFSSPKPKPCDYNQFPPVNVVAAVDVDAAAVAAADVVTEAKPEAPVETTDISVAPNMSKEASKFLNFTPSQYRPSDSVNHDSEILKLDNIIKDVIQKNSSQKELSMRSSGETRKSLSLEKRKSQSGLSVSKSEKQKMHETEGFVAWSASQVRNIPEDCPVEAPKPSSRNASRTSSVSSRSSSSNTLQPKKLSRTKLNLSNDEDESNDDSIIKISSESAEQPLTEDNQFVFAISSGTSGEVEKNEMIEKIIKLGGTVAELNYNYLIMAKLTKSSKFFSAMAAGKIILHSDYVNDCEACNEFIEPFYYEYGNPNFKCKEQNVKDRALLDGPYRCRLLVDNNPEKYEKGLFTGMKFILMIAENKKLQFTPVIQSGGGTVVDEKPEFKAAVLKRIKINYCLIDSMKMLSPKDLEVLRSCSVEVRNVKFIYEYLLGN